LIFKDINCGFSLMNKPGYYVQSFNDVVDLQHKNRIIESAMYNYSKSIGSIHSINDMTINECSKTDGRQTPVLHLLPPAYASESYSKNELIELINNTKPLFRVHPIPDASPFLPWMYQWMFDILEESSIPLLVSLQELDLKELAQTLQEYPNLIIIITNTTQWLNRQYIQIAKKFKNVYIDTSNIIEYYGIENITNILGADKLLFGTNTPEKEPYDKIFQLMYCELSKEQKECIAYRNYDRLIGGNA